MKWVTLLGCFHFCIISYSQAQTNGDSVIPMHIIDSILHTNKRHIYLSPVSIADPAFLKQYKINKVIIDSTVQKGRIPDIPAAEIYNMDILVDVEKDKTTLTNTLIITTRSFIKNKRK